MNIRKQAYVGAVTGLMLVACGWAAEEQGMAEVRHGGVTTMLKNRDFELVAKPTSLTVYVYQDEKPALTKGASATITVMRGEDKTTATMEPTGANALEAKGAFKLGPGTRAQASITLSGRKPQDVNWVLK